MFFFNFYERLFHRKIIRHKYFADIWM